MPTHTELERLKNEREQEGDNPFEFLRGSSGAGAAFPQTLSDEDNPFSFLRNITPSISDEEKVPAGQRFITGFGRGIVHPVRAFLPDGEELEEDLGVAGVIGEFTGAGLTFIPIFKGAGAVLAGVGLTRVGGALGSRTLFLTPFGQTPAGVKAAAIARGSLTFAGFETFSGTVEEAPKKFAEGLAVGLAFEAVGLPIARAWRNSRRQWKPTGPTATPQIREPSAHVHPLALKLEKFWARTGEESTEFLEAKLRSIGNPREQLHLSFVTLMRDHMRGGQAVIDGLTQKEVTQLIRKANPEVLPLRASDDFSGLVITPFRRIRGEDSFDVWIVDTSRDILSARVRSGKATLEEYIDAIKARFTELTLEFPKSVPKAVGRFNSALTTIQVATGTRKFRATGGVNTLVHEFVHFLQFKRSGPTLEGPTIEQVFNVARQDPRIGRDIVRKASLVEFREQLRRATEEVMVNNEILAGFAPNQATRDSVIKTIKGDLGYYHSDGELLSRMGELLVSDPLKAKLIAPLASRFVGGMIARDAPVIRELISRESQIVLDWFTDLWRIHGSDKDAITTVFTRGKVNPTPAILREYGRNGWAPGMRAMVDGTEFQYVARFDAKSAQVMDLSTGVTSVVDLNRLQRPLLQTMARRDEEILRAIDGMLDNAPTSVPVNLLEPAAQGGVRRAVVDLEDYATTNVSVRDWVRNLPASIQEQLIAKHGQLNPMELELMESLGPAASVERQFLLDALSVNGSKGLVVRDNGLMKIFVADKNTLIRGQVLEAQGFNARIAGTADSDILTPSIDDWLRHQLRKQGVSEVDVEHFAKLAEERFGERLRALASAPVKQVDANVKAALKKKKKGEDKDITVGEDTLEEEITRAGLLQDRLPDGQIELRDARSKTVVAVLHDEEAAGLYAKELGSEGGEVLGKFPGATNNGGNVPPIKPNDQVIPPDSPFIGGNKLADAHTLFAPIATALENFAKAAERRGLGQAYTKIYLPAHNAMLQVQRELSDVVRDGLGGVTFKTKLQQISSALVRIPRKRYAIITGHVEALTQEEIAVAGGLMERAMTTNELRIAKFIEGAGLGQDVPRLMSADRLIDSSLGGGLERTIRKMKKMQLSPEAQELLIRFEALPKIKSRDEAMDLLGLTDAERQVIKIIRDSRAAQKDKFSIMAVSRYASAPKLKKGFKNGQDQYAFENGLSKKELEVSKLVSETLEAGFSESGIDAKRHLSGYWPHLRKWVQEGFVPDGDLLPPDVLEWVATRYRSGELSVYDTDPLSTVYRHLRGLFMKRHFDPVMEQIKPALENMKQINPRAGNVMNEYVMELMGAPHASFVKLQSALSTMIETLLGKKIGDRLANDIISTLSAVASAAVIPFRPSLIARNFFESFLKVAPRTGVSHYMRGLQYVVSKETRREAFNAAMKAGAIRPGTQKIRSLHSAEELFGPGAPNIVNKYLNIFDKGFEWYQSSDDWGRAIAYHAQRFRVMDNVDDLVRGRTTMEQFLSNAKVNTFDPLDVQVARGLAENRDYEGMANHLGQVLSREAMTRYGYADHPVGWNSVVGRLFGQFGTWPVQYKDYLVQGFTRGSAKDKIEFGMTHAAISGGIIVAGRSVGVNLQNWTGLSFYTGGPFTDLSIDVMKSVNGSDLEKRLARRNLYGNIPILGWMETGNPRSIFLPGSYLIGDLENARQALSKGNIFEGIMSGAGVRIMRPEEKSPLDFIYRF